MTYLLLFETLRNYSVGFQNLFKSDFKFLNLKAGYANPRAQTTPFSLFFFFLADQGDGRRSAGDLPLDVKDFQKTLSACLFRLASREEGEPEAPARTSPSPSDTPTLAPPSTPNG
jgi:hypothetical protein